MRPAARVNAPSVPGAPVPWKQCYFRNPGKKNCGRFGLALFFLGVHVTCLITLRVSFSLVFRAYCESNYAVAVLLALTQACGFI